MKSLKFLLFLLFYALSFNLNGQVNRDVFDKLAETLKDVKQEKIFISYQDENLQSSEQSVTLDEGDILVVYALANPSSGFEWDVSSYDKNVLKRHEIPIGDANEICEAPGASVFQRLVFTSLQKGNSVIELKYHRPWVKNERSGNSCKISVNSSSVMRSTFEYIPNKPKVEEYRAKSKSSRALPAKFDWRDQGIVTPVKAQGASNACWAFGSCAGFEAVIKKKDGVERDLSEQFLGACNELGYSVSGGGWWAHDYWCKTIAPGHNAAGAVYEKDVPFEAVDTDCRPVDHHEQLEGWAYVTDIEDDPWPKKTHQPTVAQIKEKLYEWGPIPTGLCTDNWGGYKGGVLSGHTAKATTHIVLITGWDDANQCWIIKNSWGPDWGEDGYIRIKYNSHLTGWFSTYLKYKKENPRLVYGGEQFYETIANDGAIRSPMSVSLLDGGNFAISSGSLVEGTHYTVSGLPSGLTPDIQLVNQSKVKILFNGNANVHTNADDATVSITFKNAAFANGNASSIENVTSTVSIDFFDPYEIVYQDIEDLTVTTSDVWKSFNIDGNSVGIWYNYYFYGGTANIKANTFFFDLKCRKALCQTAGKGEHERFLKKLTYGDVIDPNVNYWVQGGDMGKQHRIMNPNNTGWYNSEGYVGIQFKKYGSIVYGWVRFKTVGSSLTVLDFAYNERPMAPISAGMKTEPTLAPVADFRINEDETYAGVELSLTDQSTRVPSSWTWSMPGATPSSSSQQNPKFKYNTPGIYTISLTVSNSAGTNSKTINNIVKVYQASAPVADFEQGGINVPKGAHVSFMDNSTNLPTSLLWSINGGTPNMSTDESVTSVFNNAGTYNVTLNATNPYGTGSKIKSVNVVDVPSTAYCSATSSYSEHGTVYIANVKLANMDYASAASANDYEDLRSQFASLKSGNTYPITVTPNVDWTHTSMGIWIDWNKDGDFEDVNETIYTMQGTQSYETSLTVPSTATAGMTCMRIRFHYSSKAPFACGVESGIGDCKDYTIIIDDQDGGNTGGNDIPIVNITSPNNGISLDEGSNLSINATATDSDGTITKVEFFNGTTLLGTDTNFPYSYTINNLAIGSYQLSVKATDNENATTSSSVVNVSVTGNQGCTYCVSKGTSQSYEWITGVTIGNFTNTTGKETGGYGDHTNQMINLTAGSNVNVTLNPNTSQYTEAFKVWIDYNKDCDFNDAGEEVFSGSTKGNTTGVINVPSTANGTTRMRVSMSYSTLPTGPCATIAAGEVEDYTVSFGNVTPDSQAPTAPSNLNASNISATSVDLNWIVSTDNIGVTEYKVFKNGALEETITGTSVTVSGLTANTSYSFTVKAVDAANNMSTASDALMVATTNEGTPITYCPGAHTGPLNYFYIKNVKFGTLNNTSILGNSSTGYSDYTNLSITLKKGASEVLSIDCTPSWSSNKCKVYIDWNQDGDFLDVGEEIMNVSGASVPYTSSIIVPTSAKSGLTTMRVRLTYNFDITACNSLASGETEDYRVNIVGVNLVGNPLNSEVLKVDLYPNPVSDILNIDLIGSETASIEIINLSGHVVHQDNIENSYGKINLNSLQNGLYILKVCTENEQIVKKIIIK